MASDPEQGRCVPSCCRHAIAENANSGDLSKSESCASCAAGCLPHPATYERSAFQRWHDATQHRLRNAPSSARHAASNTQTEHFAPDWCGPDHFLDPEWQSERPPYPDWRTLNEHHRRDSECTREDMQNRPDRNSSGTQEHGRRRQPNTRHCPRPTAAYHLER